MTEGRYIVVCRVLRGPTKTVRVVGPFDSSDAAITWAHKKRAERSDWLFMPDVLEPPDPEMAL